MEGGFPILDLYSIPLLIIYLQGLLFCALLAKKGIQLRTKEYLLIAALLLSVVFHYLPQLLTFMGWYMTSYNTRSGYLLISTGLLNGPLIYLYMKRVLGLSSSISISPWLHFLPFAVFVGYRLILLSIDMQSDDWLLGMEGPLQREVHMRWVLPLLTWLEYSSQLVYLAFSAQMFFRYRLLMNTHFGSIEKAAMKWLSSFLYAYSLLFIAQSILDLLDATVLPVNYQTLWWMQLGHASSVLYFGVRAFFTDTTLLKEEKSVIQTQNEANPERKVDQQLVTSLQDTMSNQQLFLNPQLSLATLSDVLDRPVSDISAAINNGFQKNFNEWVNAYRVEEVKKKLVDEANAHYSLVAIGMDCGFNSKASFNRVFRQLEGVSPSEYRQQLAK